MTGQEFEMNRLILKESENEWVWYFDEVQYDYICGRCHEHSEYRTKFCPNCGAKMKKEET